MIIIIITIIAIMNGAHSLPVHTGYDKKIKKGVFVGIGFVFLLL